MRNITTLPRAGRDLIKAPINILILGIALILLNGLRTLKVLIALKFEAPPYRPGSILIKAVTTTMKSNQFHPFLKYEFLCMMKPISTIFRTHSNKNNVVNPMSSFYII